MMKFFRFLFAEDGDRVAVPDSLQVDGAVSYEEGYGPEYELIQSDPDKRNIERRQHNQLLFDLTLNSRQYHTDGFPEFITAGENGGVAYPYNFAACVRYNGHSGPGIYYSLEDANATTPADATKWAFFNPNPSIWRTGDIKKTDSMDLEAGWLWSNGQTIGNVGSGATALAGAGALALYTMYWNTRPNSILPIQNADGTPGIRGASAAADWAALKRMPLPDRRGRVDAGHDAMGGVAAAGRLTDGNPGGVVGNQIGAFGGNQTHTLEVSQVPPVQVTVNGQPFSHDSSTNRQPPMILIDDDYDLNPQFKNFNTQGGGQSHNNVQPTIICNVMVKL